MIEYIKTLGLWGPSLVVIAIIIYNCTRSYLNKQSYEAKRVGQTKQKDTVL